MERNVLVDKLKGYACFLVLFGHVIMGVRLAGVNTPQFFAGLEKFIWSFHVALFLFLSGVVYKETGEWRGKKTKLNFIGHKLLNLGIPYIVFSAVYILINSFVGAANTDFKATDILYIWKTPVAQYWYLYALFFLFLIWVLCSGILKNWQTTLLAVMICYIVPLCGGSLGFMEVVFSSALAFGLGTCVDFKKVSKLPAVGKYIVIIAHIVVGIILIKLEKIEAPFIKEAMILFGIYSSIMLISLIGNFKLTNRFLAFMNKYSFQTYLLHTIFTAGIRIILLRVGVAQWWLHIILGTLGGIAFSIISAQIAKKTKFLDFVFFPTKTYCVLKKSLSIEKN